MEINVENINNISQWVRSAKPGDVKFAYLDCEKSPSLNTITSRYNRSLGFSRSLFVHYHYCFGKGVAVIVCESLAEYNYNIKTNNTDAWKDKIPQNFRGRA